MDSILVTGGAGFIGGNFVRQWLAEEKTPLVNLDKLSYAANLDSLADLADDPRYVFVRGGVCVGLLLARLLARHRPRAIVHFAAESHVDLAADLRTWLADKAVAFHEAAGEAQTVRFGQEAVEP